MNKIPRTSTSRYLALLAGFTALYVAYGYVSGITFGHSIRELDLFFLISALFTILVSLTGRRWSATILGTINALLLLGDPNAPIGIGLSLIPNGLVFDLMLRGRNNHLDDVSKKQFVIAGALGSLALGISGLLIVVAVGVLPTSGITFIAATVAALVGNPIIGALGAFFGTIVVERIQGRARSPLLR